MAGFRRGVSAGVTLHDEAGVRFLGGPGRREAAGFGLVIALSLTRDYKPRKAEGATLT